MAIPHDVQEFLDDYPYNKDDPSASANLKFYSNVLHCQPDKSLIDEIHENWAGNYSKLEYNHGYIQWLFPIQEHGMNFQSQPLQRHEIIAMKADPRVMERIITSYKMMLDFYGMRLISVDSGLIDRVLPPLNFMNRYTNLVRSSHNNLRISRIIKCLSEFGLEHLGIGFLLHVLSEQSESDELNTPLICSSMDRWWANCIRNKQAREWIGERIRGVRSNPDSKEPMFTREMYKDALEKKPFADEINSKDRSP